MTGAGATIGDRELDLLRWIEGCGDATVAEAAAGFGQPLSLARSTVLTMMERLRKKKLLSRRNSGGAYRYALARSSQSVIHDAVAGFVEQTLGGSLSPFVSYLAERERIDPRQVDELEALLEELRRRQNREEQ